MVAMPCDIVSKWPNQRMGWTGRVVPYRELLIKSISADVVGHRVRHESFAKRVRDNSERGVVQTLVFVETILDSGACGFDSIVL